MASATRAHNGADTTRRQTAPTTSTNRLKARAPGRPTASLGTGVASHARSAVEIRASTCPLTGVPSVRVPRAAYLASGQRRRASNRIGTVAVSSAPGSIQLGWLGTALRIRAAATGSCILPAMNAICGLILRDRRQPPAATPLQRMAEALPLRAGAGAVRTHDFAGGGFATYERFSATPDAEGRRSSVREPGLTLVCAAELYNAAALRQQFHDVLPPDASEAAIIAALYRRDELACVRQLRGGVRVRPVGCGERAPAAGDRCLRHPTAALLLQ